MSYSWQRKNVCVRDRRTYATMYSSNKNKWAQSLEQLAREPKAFFYWNWGKTRGGEEIKRGVYVRLLCIFWGAFRGCRHSYQRVCQHMSLFPNMCVQWKVNGSPVYTFLKESAMMSPWTHLEPTSVKKHYSGPPSRCLVFCSTSPSFALRSCLSRVLHWAPILLLSSF